MLVFAARRLLSYIPVLLILSFAIFSLARLVPGDVVDVILSQARTEEQAQRLRAMFGLDKGILEQYSTWLGRVLRGDLGASLFTGRPVTAEILSVLPATIELALAAVIISVIIAVPLGVIAAVRRSSFFDYSAGVIAYLGVSMPVFWSGTLLILLFSVWFGWLPSGGYERLLPNFTQGLRFLIMPAVALGVNFSALLMRITRSSFLEVLRQEYITVARSKGLSERVVLFKHAMRNATISIVTVTGVQLGFLIGGSAIVEMVFMRPGIGRLLLLSVLRRDYPMIQGLALFIALAFMSVNLLVDMFYALADPRIRLS